MPPMVLGKIKKFADDVATGVGNAASDAFNAVAGGVNAAADAVSELAALVANGIIGPSGLGRVLWLIEKIPGLELDRPQVDPAYLNNLLAVIHFGEISVVLSYSKASGTDANFAHFKTSAKNANAITGTEKFASAVLLHSEPGRPSMQLLLNKENFAKNYRYISTDAIIGPLGKSIERFPALGPVAKRVINLALRPVVAIILDLVFTQAEKLAGIVTGRTPETRALPDTEPQAELPAPEIQLDLPLPPPPGMK